MGIMYNFHCKSCGRNKMAHLGAGMMFPRICENTLKSVKAGKRGWKLKRAAESEEYVGVSAEDKIYVCDECGFWDVLADVSVYGLADKENGPNEPFGVKTIAEWGYIPYVVNWYGQQDYRLIEEYVPKCRKCGGAMHARIAEEDAGAEEEPQLKCNFCGEPLPHGKVCGHWD